MTQVEGGNAASATRRSGRHMQVWQRGLRQLHAWAAAGTLRTAIQIAVGRMSRGGRGVVERRRFGHRGAFGVIARVGGLRIGVGHRQQCMGGSTRHGRHCHRGHGVTDPIQDQADRQEQAQGSSKHVKRVRQSMDLQREPQQVTRPGGPV